MTMKLRAGFIFAALWQWAFVLAVAEDIRINSAGLSIFHETTVSARDAGNLTVVSVREGDTVATGASLGRLDNAQQRAVLVTAQIEEKVAQKQSQNDVDVRMARTALKLSQLDLSRAEESNKRFPNSVTKAELDRLRLAVEQGFLGVERAETDLETAELGLDAAKNSVELAMINLERRTINAPIDGLVVEIIRREGEWVQLGEPVLRIVRTDTLRAEAFVDAAIGANDLRGRPVTFELDVPGHGPEAFSGEVTSIGPEVNPVNGQIQLRADITNRGGLLRPGYLGKLVLHDRSETKSP